MLKEALRIAEQVLWVAVGILLGAGVLSIAAIMLLDWVLGGPACEPDDAIGCGAALVLLAAAFALPVGSLFGGCAAILLFNRLLGDRQG
jgi:hypothetical protein